MCDHFDISTESREMAWEHCAEPTVADGWKSAAQAIADEAIKRYRKEQSLAEVIVPKPSYGNFLEITRIMSGG